MEFYRLRHKATGLYYSKGTLTERGKVYTTANNYLTYLGKYDDVLYIPYGGKIHKKYRELLESLDSCKEPKFWGNPPYRCSPLEIMVKASDFEKEYIENVANFK